MATLNSDELKSKLSRIVEKTLEAQNRGVMLGMLNFQGDLLQRVFRDGLDNDGTKIGSYSTNPIYVSLRNSTSQVRSSSLRPSGKNSKDPKFKNGETRKSAYFGGGYKEYRETVGRKTDTVNLDLTGSLKGSIQIGESSNTVSLGFLTDTQKEIAEGNEKRFGKIIFSASEDEIEKITSEWEAEVTDAFFSSFE